MECWPSVTKVPLYFVSAGTMAMGKRVAVSFRFDRKVLPYEQALSLVGLESVRVTPEDSISLSEFDGLLLTGGTDVNPALYGQLREPETDEPDKDRDRKEIALLREALDLNFPVLAICRGMQLFNIVHGGTLTQHISGIELHSQRDVSNAHEIRISDGTLLERILDAKHHEVNSRHHQALRRVGNGLVVCAQAPDGIVEAVARPDLRFALAVQWHPEDLVPEDALDLRIFAAFSMIVQRARK